MSDENRRDPWSERQARAEDRAGAEYDRFERRPVWTGLGWFVKLCAILVALSLIGGLLFGVGSWVSSWGGEAKRIASPANVREQNTQIIQDYNDLEAAAQNVCAAKSATGAKGDPTLLEDPAFAYKASYRRIRVDYDRRMANLYEAQLVRKLPLPSNLRSYPKVAPQLAAMMKEVC